MYVAAMQKMMQSDDAKTDHEDKEVMRWQHHHHQH
jgi:hypothetical protein